MRSTYIIWMPTQCSTTSQWTRTAADATQEVEAVDEEEVAEAEVAEVVEEAVEVVAIVQGPNDNSKYEKSIAARSHKRTSGNMLTKTTIRLGHPTA